MGAGPPPWADTEAGPWADLLRTGASRAEEAAYLIAYRLGNALLYDIKPPVSVKHEEIRFTTRSIDREYWITKVADALIMIAQSLF